MGRVARLAALDRLHALDEDMWSGFLEGTGVLDTSPNTRHSWVGQAVDGIEHIVRMLAAAAASAAGRVLTEAAAPAPDPPLAAAEGGAGGGSSSVQLVQRIPHLQAQQGLQPANPGTPEEAAAAAAASRAATQRMMDTLVPMELQPWQSHLLKGTDSSYSGAFAMRPLRKWLAMRGAQFGPELVAAIIQRYG